MRSFGSRSRSSWKSFSQILPRGTLAVCSRVVACDGADRGQAHEGCTWGLARVLWESGLPLRTQRLTYSQNRRLVPHLNRGLEIPPRARRDTPRTKGRSSVGGRSPCLRFSGVEMTTFTRISLRLVQSPTKSHAQAPVFAYFRLNPGAYSSLTSFQPR